MQASKNEADSAGLTGNSGQKVTPPSMERGPRKRLCKQLSLTDPTDSQLFEDAAEMIDKLNAQIEELKK